MLKSQHGNEWDYNNYSMNEMSALFKIFLKESELMASSEIKQGLKNNIFLTL